MDWVFSLFGGITAAMNAVTAYLIALIAWLEAALVYLWGVLKAIADWLVKAVQKIGAFIKSLWQGGFKGFFGRLLKLYKDVHQWLETHLGPIVQFIKNAKAWWDRYYKLYVRPTMQLVQQIRRYLLILRLLHVKVATTLDNWLLQYEQAVNRVNLAIQGSFNLVIDWLNVALNPTGLGRLVLVSIASRRAAGAIVRAVTGLPLGHFFPYNGPGSFAFERQPMKVADYTNPATNPPASLIMLPLLSFMQPAELDPQTAVADVDIDAAESLPWGGTFIKDYMATTEAMAVLDYNGLSITQALQTQTGDLYNAGQATSDYIMALVDLYNPPLQ